MMYKKIYDKPEGWVKKVNLRMANEKLIDPSKPEGACLNVPPVKHVLIKHAGPRQHFSPKIVMRGITEGWLKMMDGQIILKAHPQDVKYRIMKTPGIYCCHCWEVQSGQVNARRHVLLKHAGYGEDEMPADDPELKVVFMRMLATKNHKSPVEDTPAGYCQFNTYDCLKVA